MLSQLLTPVALPALLHGSLGSWDEFIVLAVGLGLGLAIFALGGKRNKTSSDSDR